MLARCEHIAREALRWGHSHALLGHVSAVSREYILGGLFAQIQDFKSMPRKISSKFSRIYASPLGGFRSEYSGSMVQRSQQRLLSTYVCFRSYLPLGMINSLPFKWFFSFAMQRPAQLLHCMTRAEAAAEALLDSLTGDQQEYKWLPDGKHLLQEQRKAARSRSLWLVPEALWMAKSIGMDSISPGGEGISRS